jgi:hypothetical protein
MSEFSSFQSEWLYMEVIFQNKIKYHAYVLHKSIKKENLTYKIVICGEVVCVLTKCYCHDRTGRRGGERAHKVVAGVCLVWKSLRNFY